MFLEQVEDGALVLEGVVLLWLKACIYHHAVGIDGFFNTASIGITHLT